MIPDQKMTMPCTRCGTPTPIAVTNIIDAESHPQLKISLLNEQLNTAPCPQCGHINRVSTPLLYHDASKELLIALVPMELGTGKQDTERVIGDLMNRLTNSIPKEQFKAYMFNPKRALTVNGLIEQIMEAEGIDPDQINRQKERVQLLQKMIMTASEESLKSLIEENQSLIDVDLFQSITLTAQRAQAEGREDVLQKLMLVQQTLLEETPIGRELAQRRERQTAALQAVAERIQTLGQDATRADFRELAIEYADDEDKLQTLVGLVRPAFDEQFFEELTAHIEATAPDQRAPLEKLHEDLKTYAQAIDAEVQQELEHANQLLHTLFHSQNLQHDVIQNLAHIDDDFMTVLAANLQESERRQDAQTHARLREIYQTIVNLLQSQMPPEMRLINDLLSIEDPAQMQALLSQRTDELTDTLPEFLTEVEKILQSRGQELVLQRFYNVRDAIQKAMNA